MTLFVVIVHVTVCLVLILVILLQAGRGSGLSWGSFGGTPQSLLGTKSASFLTKATSVCAILFLFTCIGLNILETRKSRSLFATAQPGKIDVDKIKKVLEQVKSESVKSATGPENNQAGKTENSNSTAGANQAATTASQTAGAAADNNPPVSH